MSVADPKTAPHPFELLDEARDRLAAALPEIDREGTHYVAHLSALSQLVEIYFHRLLKPHRISYSEFRVLSTLRARPRDFRATPHDLNEAAQITSAGMTRTIERLERAGYVDRIPNPADRRSVLVGLTDSGWDFAESLVTELADEHRALLGDLDSEGCAAHIEVLRDVIARVTQAIPRVGSRSDERLRHSIGKAP